MFTPTAGKIDFQRAFAASKATFDEKIEKLLHMIGIETVAYLRSLTTEMRPPVRVGEPERQAHPGHWADITGALSGAYGYRVEHDGDAWTLVLFNTMEYAIHLENRRGFYVLSGVMERGGPVDVALRAAVAALGSDWKVE